MIKHSELPRTNAFELWFLLDLVGRMRKFRRLHRFLLSLRANHKNDHMTTRDNDPEKNLPEPLVERKVK